MSEKNKKRRNDFNDECKCFDEYKKNKYDKNRFIFEFSLFRCNIGFIIQLYNIAGNLPGIISSYVYS